MLKTKSTTIAACLFALAACGGGGSESGAGAEFSSLRSYGERGAEFSEFLSDHVNDDDGSSDKTPLSEMPRSGTATYTGSSLVYADDGTVENPHLLGRSRMTANFSDAKISGTMDQFVAKPGHTTRGGNFQFNGNIVGNTIKGGVVKGSVDLDGQQHKVDDNLYGQFYDDDADSYFVGALPDVSSAAIGAVGGEIQSSASKASRVSLGLAAFGEKD